MAHKSEHKLVEHLIGCQCEGGESPIWIPESKVLYWVDTERQVFHSLHSESSTHQTQNTPYLLQSVGRRASGGWIAVDRHGLAYWNHLTDERTFLYNPEEGKPHMTMSDGAVGPDGRFYVGSMNAEVLDAPDGAVYRVDRDGTLSIVCNNLALPNGIAFSPDGRIMYVTEMFARRILAYDFDPSSGTAQNRRVLVEVPEEEGLPDGLIVDQMGFLWSAHWQGFCITRYDPEGTVERVVEMPVPTATCMAIGGMNMNELYITTARKGCTPEQLAEYPQSGDLFRVIIDVKGRAEPEFLG